MIQTINILFPNQLLKENPIIENSHEIYLIEEYLFFRQFNFHKQKIAFHRASMQKYQLFLKKKGKIVHYIDSNNSKSDIRSFLTELQKNNEIKEINILEPNDDWLMKRLVKGTKDIKLNIYDNPIFKNSIQDLNQYFRKDRKKFSHKVFYENQRKKYNYLMEKDGTPKGGKFSFDSENRKKYPKNKDTPKISFPKKNNIWLEALKYTEKNFSQNLGQNTLSPIYPFSHEDAEKWLDEFLMIRLDEFGNYEDAILKNDVFINHSVISPLLNSGLITPDFVIQKTLNFAKSNQIPINSLEGFIRQVIGWREFIRGIYYCKGQFSRTNNFWNFTKKIPKSFYTGETGIDPIDDSIKKTLKYGYCHHIERLMVLGNFMVLCEFDPNEVYKWFMEFFIDSYDWVMVPNVYGMSQFADGGLFASKPYISSSNYIKKMSNYSSGEWCNIWDALFWNFINKHSSFFKSNPRLSMMYHLFNKMDQKKKSKHLNLASIFLDKI